MKKKIFKKIALTEKLLPLLNMCGITSSELLYASETDLNEEGEYASGALLLTKEKLYVFKAPAESAHIHYYKGYATHEEPALNGEDYTWEAINLADIDKLWVEMGVGCNSLVVRIGEETRLLAMFTQLHKRTIARLVRGIEQMKDGKEFELPEEEEQYCPKCGGMYPDRSRKVCPNCMDRRSVFFRVLSYFKPYRVKFVILFLCTVATAMLNLVWPYLNGTILYDKILGKSEPFLKEMGIKNGDFVVALLLLVLTMAATKVVQLILQMIQGTFTAQMVINVVRDMKKDVFGIMAKLSINFYKSRQTGGLMTRVMSDADRITGFFVDGAPYILIHGFTVIATIAVMLGINPMMTLLTVVLLPVLVAVSMYLRPKIWVMFGRRHRAERSLNSGVNDNLSGARVVKSFGQENREVKRFANNNKNLRDAEIAISYRQNYFHVVYGAAQSIATIGVWILGVYYLMSENNRGINLGVLITFVGYVGQLQGPMNFFANIHNWWADSMNSAQRIFEIVDAIPQVQEPAHPKKLGEPIGNISLKDVTFGYEVNRPVLKNINVDIPAGSMFGIVGRSGAGKTTLVNLISRMYDTQEGSISIDDINVKDLSFHELRKNVAMVSQDTYIFMGTVAENIAYGDRQAGIKEIMRAAKLAGAHEFIMRMPDGYDTKIGASGRQLSGGERQRISIARAILANPKILILDEATASVDTETERVIQKSINYLVQGRTTISIAHRLSTLRDADYLVVIDHGEITERGTHEELKALKGTYYKLLELQTKALDREEKVFS